ncbi:MAG: DUF2812 domain-containing protein [Lawsonibacter sp.]|nr:DUF2812 domain-containing protein [Lawsonibacter sp.]
MKYVFKIPAASELDLTGLENWLEEMALKGLYLKWYRPFLCCFTRGAPKRVRVRLEPNPRHTLEIQLSDEKEAFYRELGWNYACEIAHNALVFYNDDPDTPELHTDPTLLANQMRTLIRWKKRENFALGVVLALEAIFLVWHLRRYGIPNVRALFSTVYLTIIFVTALYTLIVSDREPLQKLKQMERDMEAGITPERLPTSPQWRRRQLLAGILQAIFFATILLAPFFSAFFS